MKEYVYGNPEFEKLSFIHEAHNKEIDCDCEECREYRRLWKIENGYED